ncbi:MAG: cytochrome C [Hyphomicrobiales bacterium]|nr:cytochrome C [Hyphomicrobiales bacterium]
MRPSARFAAATLGLTMVVATLRPAAGVDTPPPGAAACSGCHPVSRQAGTPFARLISGNAAAMIAALQEFRSGKRPATVMDRIAKGFSDEEISAIGTWYAAQKD